MRVVQGILGGWESSFARREAEQLHRRHLWDIGWGARLCPGPGMVTGRKWYVPEEEPGPPSWTTQLIPPLVDFVDWEPHILHPCNGTAVNVILSPSTHQSAPFPAIEKTLRGK